MFSKGNVSRETLPCFFLFHVKHFLALFPKKFPQSLYNRQESCYNKDNMLRVTSKNPLTHLTRHLRRI